MTSSLYNKRIGVLGGMTPESTLSFYEQLIKKHVENNHDESYPEVVMFSVDFERVLAHQNNPDTSLYVQELSRGLTALSSAGADFIVITSNTVHKVIDDLRRATDTPILSIVEATLDQAHSQNLQHLLLLGTRQTMSGGFYEKIADKLGIHLLVPSTEEQAQINHIIFTELNLGSSASSKSKQYMLDIIAKYPAEGIILGCTELDMILQPEDVAVPLLDTLQIQVQAALKEAQLS